MQSYREYHADIYPETNGYLAAMGPDDWWKSKSSKPVPKICLDPKKRPNVDLIYFNHEMLSNRNSSIKDDNTSTANTLQSRAEAEKNITLNSVKTSEENVSISIF